MATGESTAVEIGPALREELGTALALIYGRLAPEDRAWRAETLASEILSGRVSPAGLIVARRQGRLVGAVFSQLQAGKTAVLWPPRIRAQEPQATAEQLLSAACAGIAREDVCVVHALLESDDPADIALFEAQGFAPLASLEYLVSQETAFPCQRPETDLEFEPYSPSNHARLVRVVEASYEGTLDCPGLDNVRRTDDVLEGYRATGVFSPFRWLIVRSAGQDVGCLLLTDHPDTESWELIYMGLVPTARRKGWGGQIARYAQWLNRQSGRPRLVVAVDSANTPAIRMYADAGFEVWGLRIVLQRVFG